MLFMKAWLVLQRRSELTLQKYLLYVLMIELMRKWWTIVRSHLTQRNSGKASFSHVFKIHNLKTLPLTWDTNKPGREKGFIVWGRAGSLGVDGIHRHVWTGTFHVLQSIFNYFAKLAVRQPARTKHKSHCSFNNISEVFRVFLEEK